MKNKRINIFLLVMAAFLTYGGEVAFAQNKSPLKEALKDKFLIGSSLNARQFSGKDVKGIEIVKKNLRLWQTIV